MMPLRTQGLQVSTLPSWTPLLKLDSFSSPPPEVLTCALAHNVFCRVDAFLFSNWVKTSLGEPNRNEDLRLPTVAHSVYAIARRLRPAEIGLWRGFPVVTESQALQGEETGLDLGKTTLVYRLYFHPASSLLADSFPFGHWFLPAFHSINIYSVTPFVCWLLLLWWTWNCCVWAKQ